jgi:hypothetical protein
MAARGTRQPVRAWRPTVSFVEPPGPIRTFRSPLLATCKRLALELIAWLPAEENAWTST